MTRSVADRWLLVATTITVATGLVAAAASSERGAGPWLSLFDLLDWPIDGEPARFTRETAAVNAVIGGVLVGWGTLMHLIVRGPFRRGDTTLATPMLVAVVAWFLVDSLGSLTADMPGNVVLNLGFLALLVPPLLSISLATMRQDRLPRVEVAMQAPTGSQRDG